MYHVNIVHFKSLYRKILCVKRYKYCLFYKDSLHSLLSDVVHHITIKELLNSKYHALGDLAWNDTIYIIICGRHNIIIITRYGILSHLMF